MTSNECDTKITMIELNHVSKQYPRKQDTVSALDGVSLQINAGEFVVIRGQSGSGKTTLLLALGGMLHPTDGSIIINAQDIYKLSPKDRAAFRAQNIGFVFQMFHLVPYLNTIENIMLANTNGQSDGQSDGQSSSHDHVMELLNQLSLADRAYHLPSELSAGEKQRAAIARAMLNNPKLILADEPTGNLDPDNAKVVIDYLVKYQQNGGTVVFVTHGEAANNHASRIIQLEHGKLVA